MQERPINLTLGQKPWKTPKTMPFWSRLFVDARTLQILNEGTFHHHRQLAAKGLVYWGSLVSRSQVFVSYIIYTGSLSLVIYYWKHLKNVWFWPLFVLFSQFLWFYVRQLNILLMWAVSNPVSVEMYDCPYKSCLCSYFLALPSLLHPSIFYTHNTLR